ncbi:MAG: DUF2203 domain-containing protein [Gemmatimonadales bacterium]
MGMRIFTVPEAERTLPLVEKIVRDLQRDFQSWRSAVARYEVLSGGARADWGETPDLLEARTEVSSLAERINGYLGELGEIGCIFKGFDGGLVDFYALREDRLVFLCWRLGEPHIRFWHEVDDGFAGRQPLDREMTSGVKP